MFFCQILAAVEVLNAAFGVVRTGVIPTLIQVFDAYLPEFEFHDVQRYLLFITENVCNRYSINFSLLSAIVGFAFLLGGWTEFYPLHHFW